MPSLLLNEWIQLDNVARRNLARSVQATTENRFEFQAIMPCELAGASHDIAMFDQDGVGFALIPGTDHASLGWDGAPVSLSDDRRRTWQDEAAMEGVEFESILRPLLRPQRGCAIAPMLVEREPRRLADLCDPYATSYEQVCALVAVDMFRLPTSYEWEWCCRGGVLGLFRWGNEWPVGIPYGRETNFESHKLSNAFGLTLGCDPYQVELVEDRIGFVGGDGGTAICGGRPSLETWLPLASAFLYPIELAQECLADFFESAWVRRVYPVRSTMNATGLRNRSASPLEWP